MNDLSATSKPLRLQAGQQGPLRHRGEPVRRPRRVDQHHAADPAGDRLRGHPPRPQPRGRGDRHLRAAGGRARHRDLVLPGRARRVLQVHDRPPARARRRPRQGVRRRRRRDRAGGDPRAPRLRGGADLHARGRAAAGAAGDDQRDRRRLRHRPRQGAARRAVGADRRRRARADALARTAHHRPRGGDGAGEAARRDARGGEGDADADAGDHRHRRRGQELAHRRDRPPLPPRPGRPAADRDRVHRPVAAQVRRGAARRPHPDERDRAPEHLHALARHARGRQAK